MNPVLIAGTAIVTCALVTYSVFMFLEERHTVLTPTVLTALSLGILLDITSTMVMIAGSRNIPITPHGILGYSALSVMLIDTVLIWRHWRGAQRNEPLSKRLRVYTRCAYSWWVIAYFAGAMLAAFALS